MVIEYEVWCNSNRKPLETNRRSSISSRLVHTALGYEGCQASNKTQVLDTTYARHDLPRQVRSRRATGDRHVRIDRVVLQLVAVLFVFCTASLGHASGLMRLWR
jgi:hypothetical protein